MPSWQVVGWSFLFDMGFSRHQFTWPPEMQARFIASVRHNDWGVCMSVTHRCEGTSSHNSGLLRGVSWRFWNTVVKYGSKCGSFSRLSGNASVGVPVTALSETTGSNPLYRSHKIIPCATVDHLRKRRGEH